MDLWLAAACLASSALGLLLLAGIAHSGMASAAQLRVQALATALGIGAGVAVSLFDYRWVAARYKLYIPVGVGLVALTYLVGMRRQDALAVDDQAWLAIPFTGLTFQPSELLKLAFILSFSLHLSQVHDRMHQPGTVAALCLHGAVPTALVMGQGDHGTALVFVFIFLVMIFVAGLPWKYIAMGAAAGAAASPVAWLLMGDDKRQRILNIFTASGDASGIDYQQNLGIMSIGAGQVWGRGIFAGEHNYVPELRNDFIFAFAGEALGYVGCLGILALLGFLCLRILWDAQRAADLLGRFICLGVFAMLSFQVLVNLGMCLRLFPVVGITLPFISAGGTSVVSTYLSIGLVWSVRLNSRSTLFLNR